MIHIDLILEEYNKLQGTKPNLLDYIANLTEQ